MRMIDSAERQQPAAQFLDKSGLDLVELGVSRILRKFPVNHVAIARQRVGKVEEERTGALQFRNLPFGEGTFVVVSLVGGGERFQAKPLGKPLVDRKSVV